MATGVKWDETRDGETETGMLTEGEEVRVWRDSCRKGKVWWIIVWLGESGWDRPPLDGDRDGTGKALAMALARTMSCRFHACGHMHLLYTRGRDIFNNASSHPPSSESS
jgi:hypothetical protein